jgi:acetyl esterase/lipase
VHGWGDTSPAHHAWFDHLRARGVAVVFPRYQVDTSDPAPGTIGHLRNGLRHAFADPALRGKPVVAVGYSWGAKLVFDYGVNAKRWGVPAPRAIESIFPPSRTYGGPPHGRLTHDWGGREDAVGRRLFWAPLDGLVARYT